METEDAESDNDGSISSARSALASGSTETRCDVLDSEAYAHNLRPFQASDSRLKGHPHEAFVSNCTEWGLICPRWDWCQKDPDAGYFRIFTPVVSAGTGDSRERWKSCRACAATHGAEETATGAVSGAYNVEQFGWRGDWGGEGCDREADTGNWKQAMEV
ncbi:hypothetical protein L207DRAFT_593170 [Hyaloscypha variabilis F]|uniref:Uncharacterized protein n=1 Tax=Hyaloscypha variabilis (strain UAMH 11265 / GT02V1 / F) TaxID=1149755 RepID=A0A2J6QUC0_HYAVF|nr:hypothetical protein L207DRAFT_593170 [Hyaloscypha variabilis F]